MVFEGSIGGDALPGFYRAFIDGGLARARAEAIGHYAIAIRHGNRISAFTDDQGSLSLYCVRQGHDYVISNSLQVIVETLDSPAVDPLGLISHVLQIDTVGEDTFYLGVKRLFGSQSFEIDLTAGETSVRDIPQTMLELAARDDIDIDRAVSLYASEVRRVFGQLASIESLGLNATGGLDTRTVLAALLEQGASPLLMYGVGNSELTNTKTADLQVAQTLSQTAGLPFHRMDWSGNQPHSTEKLRALFKKHGFKFTTYGASDGLLRELQGGISPYPALQFGGYCPAFTNMKPWEKKSGRYSFADLIHNFTSLAKYLAPGRRDGYLTHVEASVRQALEKSPVDFPETGATLEDFVRARLFLYIRPESKSANFFNEFSYYLAPFITKRLYDPLLTFPLEFRRGDAFQIRLAYTLAPQLFEAPIFSGLMPQTLDLDTLTMKRTDSGRKLAFIKRLLPRSAKQAIRQVLVRSKVAAKLAGLSVDLVKDSEVTALVREDSLAHIFSHPITADVFRDLNLIHLPYVHNLRLLLFAVDEIERASAGWKTRAP